MNDIEKNEIKNELRREVLDSRTKIMDWWVFIVSLFIGAVGVSFGAGGIIFAISVKDKFNEFNEITDKARRYVEEIEIDRAVSEAIVLKQQNRNREAIKKWRSIAKMAEGTNEERAAEAWFHVGYIACCTDVKDFEGAIEAYDKAIRLDPDESASYNNRAKAKIHLGQYKEALADCDKAIRLDPSEATAYNTRGTVKIHLGQYKEALADCDKAILLRSDYAEAYSTRGNAKLQLGQYKEALADYDEAILLRSNFAAAHYNRGNAKFHLGQEEAARQDFETARNLAQIAGNADIEAQAERILLEVFDGSQ